jgi:hypothetical protein
VAAPAAASSPAVEKKPAPASKAASVKASPIKAKVAAKATKTAPAQKTSKPTKLAKQAKSAKPVKPAKAVRPLIEKPKKPKLVRDSFTMPKDEYEQIAALKLSLAKQGRPVKKSELLRAGLLLLSKQTAGAQLACIEALTPIKTGRPRKD